MKRFILITTTAGLLAVTAFTAHQHFGAGAADSTDLTQPAAAAISLLEARPFVLEDSYTGWYRAEQPQVDAGWLLVLSVPTELALPHQSMDRVLYVGAQTAERWNSGQPSGQIVVTVPTSRGADGLPTPLSEDDRIWFGTPELPERVDAQRIADELELARAAQLPTLPAQEWESARERGAETLHAKNYHELSYAIADLVEIYSASETETIEELRSEPTR